jgi:predicted phosphoribosyltransferase
VIALCVDPDFAAVSQFYVHFPQVSDEEVVAMLAGAVEPDAATPRVS